MSSEVPMDLAWNSQGIYVFNSLPARPAVGDGYTVHVDYPDGSFDDLSLPVTAVLNSFAMPIYPAGNTGPDSTQPLFAWLIPNQSGYYTYRIWVNDNFSTIWEKNDAMLSTQLSVRYNDDGNASLPSLTPGTNYSWTVAVQDAMGNQAQYLSTFTPSTNGATITSFSPSGGTDNTPIDILGSFSGTPPVYFGPFSATITASNSASITADIPSNAPVGPIKVIENGTVSGTSTSATPMIAYSGTFADSSGTSIGSANISTIGLHGNPNYSDVSVLGSAGAYSGINVPAGVPFYLHFTSTGFLDMYTSMVSSTSNNTGSAYTLLSSSDITNFQAKGLSFSSTTGLIHSRVANWDGTCNSSVTSGCVSGAVVTAASRLHPNTPYTVVYTNGSAIGGTATASDGKFYVENVEEGDYVTVTASYSGWGFQTRTYVGHANAVSENKVQGNCYSYRHSIY